MTGIRLSRVFSYFLSDWRPVCFFLLGAMLLSCSGYTRVDRPRGVYHRVKSGETLAIIAKAYHVNLQDLAEINNIRDPDRIEADSVVFVPEANQVLDDVLTAARSPEAADEQPIAEPQAIKAKTTPPAAVLRKEPVKKEAAAEAGKRRERMPADVTAKDRHTLPRTQGQATVPRRASVKPEGEPAGDLSAPKGRGDAKTEEVRFEKDRFIWPIKGKVVSRFGIQPNKMYLNGIRIAAGEGTAVQAAAGGMVIFSAPLKAYGETIIIKHDDDYATVYTHLGTRTVRGEAQVKKGDRIAFLGKSVENEEPYLHFEIRHKNKARNPLFFLP